TGAQIQQPELADILDIPLRTLKAQLKSLKEEGVIDLVTEKGRYSKGTVFTYVPNKTFEYEVETRLNMNLIDYNLDVKKA
ncbi:winged helix-turn-helix transcriptional regulator, partial [Streptococcus agalactiae]